jgi:hypothetical protein
MTALFNRASNDFTTLLINKIHYQNFLKRLWKNRLLRGWWKMSIPQPLLRDEIPRNEAYIDVRRSASGPEGLRLGGTRDESNAADGRFPTAFKDFSINLEIYIQANCLYGSTELAV